MEESLQVIYEAIDRGVQKGIYNANEVMNVLTAFNNVAVHFVQVPTEQEKVEETQPVE
jgi:hypothetical protein